MLLALLMLVPGRLEGALGGPPDALLFDSERDMKGASGPPMTSCDAGLRS